MDAWTSMAESLCCAPGAITALLIFLQPILFASDFSLKVQPRKIKKERSWGWERIEANYGD